MDFQPILSYVAAGITISLLTWNSLSRGGRDTSDFAQFAIFFYHVSTPCQETFHVIIPFTSTIFHPREQEAIFFI